MQEQMIKWCAQRLGPERRPKVARALMVAAVIYGVLRVVLLATLIVLDW
jgi:hypothetical protein